MQRKNIIIVCVAVVISFIVGFFIGDATAINRVKRSLNNSVANTTNSTGNTTNDTTNSTSTKSKESKNYKFNEEGKSGNWNIKVLDSQETTTIQGGNSSDNKTTEQKFIVVKLQMTDVDSVPHQYSPTEFILGNAKDKKQYNTAFEAMQTANGKETIYNQNNSFFGTYDDINPSTPKQTYIIFEVAKDFNIADGVLIHGTNDSDIAGYYIK